MGADIVSHVTSDGKQVLAKTKAPNIVGKWNNTLAGAFVGIGLATIYDLFTKKVNSEGFKFTKKYLMIKN